LTRRAVVLIYLVPDLYFFTVLGPVGGASGGGETSKKNRKTRFKR